MRVERDDIVFADDRRRRHGGDADAGADLDDSVVRTEESAYQVAFAILVISLVDSDLNIRHVAIFIHEHGKSVDAGEMAVAMLGQIMARAGRCVDRGPLRGHPGGSIGFHGHAFSKNICSDSLGGALAAVIVVVCHSASVI